MAATTSYPDVNRLRHGLRRVQETPSSSGVEPWTDASINATTLASNMTETNATAVEDAETDLRYAYVSTLLVIFCLVSVLINIKVLLSSYWIKKPLSPTLHISLSLAGADAFTSFQLGLGLFINSFLESGLRLSIPGYIPLVVEVFRLGGIIITIAHLLALAVNHYLGIIKPLHYPSILTHRNRTICIILMWIIPITFMLVYFSMIENEGFQSEYCNVTDFLGRTKFRTMYSSIFFCPLILMSIIYTHIFFIVRQHQRRRSQWSQWSQHSREGGEFPRPVQQRDITMSIKAIKTTLLILGSYIVGLMPAVMIFFLVCKDCVFTPLQLEEAMGDSFYVYVVVNFLIIFKTMLNPIVYAARMHEIKKASALMKSRICRCCLYLSPDNDSLDTSMFGLSMDSTQQRAIPMLPTRSNTIISRARQHDPLANGSKTSLTRMSTRSHQRRREELTSV